MPFGRRMKKIFSRASQGAVGLFNRDAEDLKAFETLLKLSSISIEMDDWGEFDTACGVYVKGDRTEFPPVNLSVYGDNHTQIYKAAINPDGMTLRYAHDQDDDEDNNILFLRPADKDSWDHKDEELIFQFCHPSGLVLFNVVQLTKYKHEFRVYPAGDEDDPPHFRIVKETTTKHKMAQKMGMTFSGTITHIRDTGGILLANIFPKIGPARSAEIYNITYSKEIVREAIDKGSDIDYRDKGVVMCLALMWTMRVACAPLFNVMKEHMKRNS